MELAAYLILSDEATALSGCWAGQKNAGLTLSTARKIILSLSMTGSPLPSGGVMAENETALQISYWPT